MLDAGYGQQVPLPLAQGGTGSTSKNFVDLSTTQSVAGAKTFTNGIGPINTGFTSFATGGAVNLLNASSGAVGATVSGSIYWAALLIPMNVTLTGVIFTVGTGGTDKWIGALYNSSGALIANTLLTGTTSGTSATKQAIPFTGTVAVSGPSVYYIALQSNGATNTYRAFANTVEGFITGSTTGSFGTLPSITPGTTYTANIGPFASTY